jgi:hypothetical protein
MGKLVAGHLGAVVRLARARRMGTQPAADMHLTVQKNELAADGQEAAPSHARLLAILEADQSGLPDVCGIAPLAQDAAFWQCDQYRRESGQELPRALSDEAILAFQAWWESENYGDDMGSVAIQARYVALSGFGLLEPLNATIAASALFLLLAGDSTASEPLKRTRKE